jgi:hypothetical protein
MTTLVRAAEHATIAHFKLVNQQMAEQTGAREPLGGVTSAEGVEKELSPTPAALTGRRKRANRLDYRRTVCPDGCVSEDDL